MRLLESLRGDEAAPVAPAKSQTIALAAALALSAIAVLASRRTTTLTAPYLWAEDGLDMVPQFVLRGWQSLLDPISGYMAFVPRLISYISLSATPAAYPLTSTLLSWIFMAACVAAIALAPTRLRARPWLALACLFVPSDPEVFGTSLYSFWWIGLLLMLLTMWEPGPRLFKSRLALIVVGGLSTPLTIMAAPLIALRALVMRTREDVIIAAAAVICAAFQIREVLAVHTDTMATTLSWRTLLSVFDKFFGRYAWGIDTANQSQEVWLPLLGIGLALLICVTLFRLADRWLAFCLLYLLGGAIVLSIMRVSVDIMGPTGGGPRYFFYPYVLLSWILIQGVATPGPRFARTLCGAALLLALINAAASGWHHPTDTFSLRREIQSCTHFDAYAMPIHKAGSRFDVFRGLYPRAVCRYLASRMVPVDENELQPFTWLHLGHAMGSRQTPEIIGARPEGTSAGAPPERYIMVGTFGAAAETGTITIAARRGDLVLISSGAAAAAPRYEVRTATHTFTGALPICPEACTLAFTSDLLPEAFTVTLTDDSEAPGDWFALGIPVPP